MKKRILTAATVATMSAAGLSAGAFAVTQTASGTDPMGSLVSAIASKFNLNESDVQAVFDSQRSKMEASREAEALVKEGKLTQAQANKINAKRAEMKTEREADRDSMKNKTESERRSAMETKKKELDTWLKENDIDSEYAYLLMGGHPGGPGGPGGFGGSRPASSSSSTNS